MSHVQNNVTMFQLGILCIILFMGQQYAAGVLKPDYEYVPEADVWLRLHRAPAVWQDARLRCQLEGGILASPSSTAITNAMLSIMTAHKVNRQVYIGIHALISEGDFMSLDGVPLTNIHLDWAAGEPDDQDENENCLVLNPTGDVADVSCTSALPYFCRKDSAVMNVSQLCPTTDKEYVFERRTGSCYKFHRVSQIWHRAAMACHAEGAHLAIINGDIEAEVLKDILKRNPLETIFRPKHSDVALVGFWKWDDEDGEWLTINGQTLDEAGFTKWSDDDPNKGPVSTYGAIQRSGLLDAVNKYDKDPFICEISPY